MKYTEKTSQNFDSHLNLMLEMQYQTDGEIKIKINFQAAAAKLFIQ